jgi:uncharacterized protein (TIGR02118 family)
MTKLVFCLRRKEGMTFEEFQRYWLESHAPLVRSLRTALPSMTRYVQSHTAVDLTDLVRAARNTGEDPYDGVTEIWVDLGQTVAEAATPAGTEALARLLQDELTFIDMERSNIFMTVEHDIF